jgi:hypothetical protein
MGSNSHTCQDKGSRRDHDGHEMKSNVQSSERGSLSGRAATAELGHHHGNRDKNEKRYGCERAVGLNKPLVVSLRRESITHACSRKYVLVSLSRSSVVGKRYM